ncbi:M23 family peptidase [Schaalia cardiffensis F0333]|uniref:M23 family peptidase n=1 Tax=Schaalia cardiffensis F0333 TaxID=888050 RepID=N6WF96_9ACTO|nr:M23 family metallopeptidase [Schaalia cardiffensis]ENO18924.1 M23 family peptidase [Schaalia cardiffensis F0333]
MSDLPSECPYPSRRQIHARTAQDAPIPSSHTPRSLRRGAVRISVLAALSAMTVALPLSGTLGAECSVEFPTRSLGYHAQATSWATQISPQTATPLSGSQTAASRTRVRTPLTLTTCLPSDVSGSGERSLDVNPMTIYWPLMEGTYEVTSPFGTRVNPVSGQVLVHEGVDMAAPMDTPLYSIYAGEVVEVAENSHSGAYVKIKHTGVDGTVFYSAYLHQYMNKIRVTTGEKVEAGQEIGAVGSNGWSTGPHLHFEIRDSTDKPVDPQEWMANAGALYIGQRNC